MAFLIIGSTWLFAGGRHDFLRPVFVYRHHPDLPVERFLAGELGIPEPQTARFYLLGFYRYLNNQPISASEQRSWLTVWNHRVGRRADGWMQPWRDKWYKDRGRAAPEVPWFRFTDFVWGRGVCADDAFATALATLQARRKAFGADTPEFRLWLEGQDAVFDSCNPNTFRLPPPLPPNAPLILRQDRAYQTASALLYGLRLDEANAAFRQIAADRASPWQPRALYLAGRALVWKARVTEVETASRAALVAAQRTFFQVLSDRRLSASHAAAERLLIRCMLITDERRAMERLAGRLARPSAGEQRTADLLRYLEALDLLEETAPRPADDLSVWIFNMQSINRTQAYQQALARWQSTGSRAWLFAALASGSGDSTDIDRLMDAANGLSADLPGSDAIRYHTARLSLERGDAAASRSILDDLARRLSQKPSAFNRVRSLRMLAAASPDEFLSLAARAPILDSTEWDTAELEPHYKRLLESDKKEAEFSAALAREKWLDDRAEAVLSLRLPLDVLSELAGRRGVLSRTVAEELDLMVWTRAVLLARWQTARAMAPKLATAHPALAQAINGFIKAADGPAAEEAAAFVLLRLPGAKPYMSRGYGRRSERIGPTQSDGWLKNWWYSFTESDMHQVYLPYRDEFSETRATSAYLPPSLPFLTQDQESAAAGELTQLSRTGQQGQDWIAKRILLWAKRNPRAPAVERTLFDLLAGNAGSWWIRWVPAEAPLPNLEAAKAYFKMRFRKSPLFDRLVELRVLQ